MLFARVKTGKPATKTPGRQISKPRIQFKIKERGMGMGWGSLSSGRQYLESFRSNTGSKTPVSRTHLLFLSFGTRKDTKFGIQSTIST